VEVDPDGGLLHGHLAVGKIFRQPYHPFLILKRDERANVAGGQFALYEQLQHALGADGMDELGGWDLGLF
jgi:hypothetical protein